MSKLKEVFIYSESVSGEIFTLEITQSSSRGYNYTISTASKKYAYAKRQVMPLWAIIFLTMILFHRVKRNYLVKNRAIRNGHREH